MVRIGLVGIGFMGMVHYRAAKRLRGAKVVAICTRDPRKRAGDWRSIRGNFGRPGGLEDLRGIATYERLDDLLADRRIDLVDICLPNALHASASIAALRAGKHVLVEKPIASTLAEADRMLKAAREARRHLLVGQVLVFLPEYRFLYEAVASGRYGRLLAACFKRLTAMPACWESRRGSDGPAVNLHVHDMHFIQLLAGRPDRLQARGLVRADCVVYAVSQLLYNRSDVTITAITGWMPQPACSFVQAFEAYLERATIAYEFATLRGRAHRAKPLTLLSADGRVHHPPVGGADPSDAFAAELQHAVDVVRGRVDRPLIDARGARDALALCLLENAAVRRGQTLAVR